MDIEDVVEQPRLGCYHYTQHLSLARVETTEKGGHNCEAYNRKKCPDSSNGRQKIAEKRRVQFYLIVLKYKCSVRHYR